MTKKHGDMIRQLSKPMKPVATSRQPVLKPLGHLRAVLFDVYGTLLISSCGDFGTSRSEMQRQSIVEVFAQSGIGILDNGQTAVQFMGDAIAAEHERLLETGVDYPEVDIVEIWRQTLRRLIDMNLASGSLNYLSESDFRDIALAYELRINPVWPMPHAETCLGNLYRMGLRLGVISNAQFLTLELLQTLLQSDSGEFSLDDELQFYSFQHQRAKPGLGLYQMAARTLARRGIKPAEVLYVGNDMLNDIMPAHTIGFRTALFAGDARSLRCREDDPRVAHVSPDIVISDLLDIEKCIR